MTYNRVGMRSPAYTFLLVMPLNTISMLEFWPMLTTIGPLAAFKTLDRVASGSLYMAFSTVTARMFREEAAIIMSIATPW